MQFENVCLFCHGFLSQCYERFFLNFLLFGRQYFVNSATVKGILWQYAGWQERICSLCRLFVFIFIFFFFSLSNVHNLDMKLKFICAPLSPFQLCKQGCWYDNVQDYHVHSTNTCGQVMRHKPLPGSRVVLKWPGCLVHHTSSSPGLNNTSRPQAGLSSPKTNGWEDCYIQH